MPSDDHIAHLIEERKRQQAGRQGLTLSLGAAALLHGGVLFALTVIDAQREKSPVDYVAVRVVPMAEISSPRPSRPNPSKPPVPAPTPKPEPQKPASARPDPKPLPKKPPAKPSDHAPGSRPETDRPAQQSEPEAAAPPAAPGAAAHGSPFGLNALEGIDPDFTYDYYLEQMLSLIRRQWVRPATVGAISTAVRFTVLKTGEISELEIAEPSGFNAFDLAALRAVQNASPLPRLPASYRRSELRVTLIVR